MRELYGIPGSPLAFIQICQSVHMSCSYCRIRGKNHCFRQTRSITVLSNKVEILVLLTNLTVNNKVSFFFTICYRQPYVMAKMDTVYMHYYLNNVAILCQKKNK